MLWLHEEPKLKSRQCGLKKENNKTYECNNTGQKQRKETNTLTTMCNKIV